MAIYGMNYESPNIISGYEHSKDPNNIYMLMSDFCHFFNNELKFGNNFYQFILSIFQIFNY